MKKILGLSILALACTPALAQNMAARDASSGKTFVNGNNAQPDTVCFYGGDFDTRNGFSSERNTAVTDSWTFDDFSWAGGTVSRAFSNYLDSGLGTPTGADVIVYSGMAEGSFGTVRGQANNAAVTVTPTGNSGFGLPEQHMVVALGGQAFNLPAGTYHLGIRAVGTGSGQSFVSTTSGANSVGSPIANGHSFFQSGFFGYPTPTDTQNVFGTGTWDVSYGVDCPGGGGPVISSYDIRQAARSGFGGWAHTYSGTIVDTGNFSANGINFTRADYSGGSGTLNDGSEGAGPGDTQLFANNSNARPEITLHLNGTYKITSLKMFSFDSGNSIPGSIGECSVTIGNVTEHFVTIEQATNDDFIDLSNSQLSGICTDTVKLSRFAHDGRQNGLDELFSIGEIRLTGSACTPGMTVSATGSCPGQLTISWSGAAPNSTVALIFSLNTGSFQIPFGPCQGTVLGLGSNHIQLVGTFGSNGSGGGSIVRNVPAVACRRYIQMHDIPNCTTSNVFRLP